MPDVIWRPEAQAALYHLVAYISEHDPAAAQRMLGRIIESMEPARHFPHFGRIGRVPSTREAIAHPNYIVVYRVLTDVVEVLDVVHARRQYP